MKRSSKIGEIVSTIGENDIRLWRWLKDGVDNKYLKVLKGFRIVNKMNSAEIQLDVVNAYKRNTLPIIDDKYTIVIL